jgi:hypothetical protein
VDLKLIGVGVLTHNVAINGRPSGVLLWKNLRSKFTKVRRLACPAKVRSTVAVFDSFVIAILKRSKPNIKIL